MIGLRTANPALNREIFTRAGYAGTAADRMTVEGTINRTAILLLCVILTASLTWKMFLTAGFAAVTMWMYLGLIGGFIVAMVTIFNKTWAPVTAPLYALLEGLALGGISAALNKSYPGIVVQALFLTFGVLFCMLFAYRTGIIRPTRRFMMGIVAATGAIGIVYLASFILGFFGIGIPFIHSSGPVGIAFSVVVVIIAALNLILDFMVIETGASSGAPKYMEWYGAFGLMVTLVWLYIEILRLLVKLNSRD